MILVEIGSGRRGERKITNEIRSSKCECMIVRKDNWESLVVQSYLQGKHYFPALLRVHSVVTFHQNVSPQAQTTEIHGELASIRHGVEIRGVDGVQTFVDLEECPATRGLEQWDAKHGEMR